MGTELDERSAGRYEGLINALEAKGFSAVLSHTMPWDEQMGLAIRVALADASGYVWITAKDLEDDSVEAWDTGLPEEGPEAVAAWCVSLYSSEGASLHVDRWAVTYTEAGLIAGVRRLSQMEP
jgi:hypothetical protein